MKKISAYKLKRGYFEGLKGVCYISLLLALVALLGVIIFTFVYGGGSLNFRFIFGKYSDEPSILPAIVGTLYLILVSLSIATPLGIATAIFISEYTLDSTWYVNVIRVAIETLASIPSIVYGLFGYLVFVVSLGWGYSLLGGGLTLAIMILPLIVKNTEEALKEVPDSLREASLSLGSTKIRTIFKVVLPTAAPGILTSIILSIGRVVSESAVLLLTIGMVVNLVPTDLMSSGTSLALNIYYFATFGYIEEAGATAVVLLFIVLLLNVSAYLVLFFIERRRKHGK